MNDARGAFEWGVASSVLGGVLIVAAAPVFEAGQSVYSAVYLSQSLPGGVASAVALSIPAAFAALAFAGTAFGFRSMSTARREARPIAMGLCGTLLNVTALALWAGVALAWYALYGEGVGGMSSGPGGYNFGM